MNDYIARPTEVLMAYMQWSKPPAGFDWGRLALGLEVVTLIRTLEAIPVVNDAERQGTIATLITLLREQGLEDAYGVYDTLSDWRRVRFEPLPPTIAYAGAPSRRGRGDNGPSSLHASADPTRAPQDTQRALPPVRRDPAQDASPTGEQLALPFAGESETPSA